MRKNSNYFKNLSKFKIKLYSINTVHVIMKFCILVELSTQQVCVSNFQNNPYFWRNLQKYLCSRSSNRSADKAPRFKSRSNSQLPNSRVFENARVWVSIWRPIPIVWVIIGPGTRGRFNCQSSRSISKVFVDLSSLINSVTTNTCMYVNECRCDWPMSL